MKVTIQQAANLLNDGFVVAVPTETVYGLAASLRHPQAIQKIFSYKNRPLDNPLITHVADISAISEFIDQYPPGFMELATAFWPGPITFVLPIKEGSIPSIVTAGLSTAAFRVPNHVEAVKLLKKTGPLVMPSANISGRPSSTTTAHVESDFGSEFPVVDGGGCKHGLESTVLIFRDGRWIIGRLGAISARDIEKILRYQPEFSIGKSQKPACPGQKYRHYAPRAQLFLGGEVPTNCRCILGFDDRKYLRDANVIFLGTTSDPMSVANRLYDTLRHLDAVGLETAWVDMDFPHEGLWRTIRERLEKAAGEL
ncbi:MAG: L-threonylcarbamoyladenylate synthase [Chlamydiota bacterium]|nr:L-threonylcarbamoyladenylate synthase [Chlamydiota bacterium]